MVNTGFDVLFFFILTFSSFYHGHINYVIIFLKGLKSTVNMIHIKPANQTEAALLRCHRHVLLGNLLKHCRHLGNEEKYSLPWRPPSSPWAESITRFFIFPQRAVLPLSSQQTYFYTQILDSSIAFPPCSSKLSQDQDGNALMRVALWQCLTCYQCPGFWDECEVCSL